MFSSCIILQHLPGAELEKDIRIQKSILRAVGQVMHLSTLLFILLLVNLFLKLITNGLLVNLIVSVFYGPSPSFQRELFKLNALY